MPASRAFSSSASARLQKLRRVAADARFKNFVDTPVAATQPTVTTTYDSTLSTFFTYAANPTAFNFYGGPATSLYGGYTAQANQVGGGYNSATLEFCTDAPKLQMRTIQGCSMLVVDEQPISASGVATAAGGGEQQIVLDWGGVRKVRTYRALLKPDQPFLRVGVDSLSRIWAPSNDDVVRLAIDGDSYMAGSGLTSAVPLTMANIAAEMLGIKDVWNGAVGGTGWLNAGAAQTIRGRISNLISAAPDEVWVAAGTNDSPSGIQTEVQTYLTQLRAGLPNVPIILFGPWPKATGPSQTILDVEAAILAAVTAQNDPMVKFVPVASDDRGSWLFGTGSNGSGSGNAALYLGSDGVHPNNNGHLYLGRRIAAAVSTALRAL